MDMTVAALIAALLAAACAVAAVVVTLRASEAVADASELTQRSLAELDRANAALAALVSELARTQAEVDDLSRQQVAATAAEQQRFDATARGFSQVQDRVDALRRETAASLERNRDTVDARLGEVRQVVERQLTEIRADNARQLDRMRETVDEKLSRTLNDRLSTSFKQVSDSLEVVSQGLGEMRSVAAGVGDLRRVLSGVKTRGILGEVQLGAILREVLSPDQYLEDVATVPGSSERVEFAVRLPQDGAEPILMPIDSKFPGDAYEHVRQAVEAGDADAVVAARRALERQIKNEAKDISRKYLSVPATTNFGIMFLPFEGLYAEVVNMPGLVECLQRDYRVSVAGPSTMAAILNSLQMSYQTFAFQKRADEIQRVLAAVKAEFPRYQDELAKALRQIRTAEKTVDGIISTRTNAIERKLKEVTALDDPAEAALLLGIGASAADAEDADATVEEPDQA